MISDLLSTFNFQLSTNMKPNAIKQTVKDLQAEKQKLQDRLKIIEGIIETYQNKLCPHQYEDGRSAIEEDAPLHPASSRQCQICGKYF